MAASCWRFVSSLPRAVTVRRSVVAAENITGFKGMFDWECQSAMWIIQKVSLIETRWISVNLMNREQQHISKNHFEDFESFFYDPLLFKGENLPHFVWTSNQCWRAMHSGTCRLAEDFFNSVDYVSASKLIGHPYKRRQMLPLTC